MFHLSFLQTFLIFPAKRKRAGAGRNIGRIAAVFLTGETGIHKRSWCAPRGKVFSSWSVAPSCAAKIPRTQNGRMAVPILRVRVRRPLLPADSLLKDFP